MMMFTQSSWKSPWFRKENDAQLGEIRLSRDGAQGRELIAVKLHPIVALLVHVLENFQHLGCVGRRNLAFVAQGLQVVLLSIHFFR